LPRSQCSMVGVAAMIERSSSGNGPDSAVVRRGTVVGVGSTRLF